MLYECSRAGRAAATALLAGAGLGGWGAAAAQADEPQPWPLAGRQGVIQVVIVPDHAARDPQAYARQIERLCAPQAACFVNFHTNSTGAPVAVPLPDAIAQESTAVFRRSVKQGGEYFRWSCRMGIDAANCF